MKSKLYYENYHVSVSENIKKYLNSVKNQIPKENIESRRATAFNTPNLTSVERLSRVYEFNKNIFSLLIVQYSANDVEFVLSDVVFVPIEFLDWICLTVGAFRRLGDRFFNASQRPLNSSISAISFTRSWVKGMFGSII